MNWPAIGAWITAILMPGGIILCGIMLLLQWRLQRQQAKINRLMRRLRTRWYREHAGPWGAAPPKRGLSDKK